MKNSKLGCRVVTWNKKSFKCAFYSRQIKPGRFKFGKVAVRIQIVFEGRNRGTFREREDCFKVKQSG